MAAAAGITEELVSKAKQSRTEKKARKAMSKLGTLLSGQPAQMELFSWADSASDELKTLQRENVIIVCSRKCTKLYCFSSNFHRVCCII